ncbi:MAG: ABC transporter substrate-binding protein [Paenibacillaceae bacterium]
MKNMRWFAALVVIVMVLGTLMACSNNAANNTGNNTKGNNTTNAEQPTTNGKKVEVTFWGDWGGDGAIPFNVMVDAFNKSQDKIHVTYVIVEDMITKFLTASTSGGSPDIMFWDRWRTASYAPKGVLAPIDEFMKADGVPNTDFYEQALKELSSDGKLYGLPLTVDARALFYNKTILAEKGLNPPTTWDELADVAKQLTVWEGDKLVRSGFSLADVGLFNMTLQQAGGQMLNEDGTKPSFNSPEGLKVLEFWNKLMNVDKVYKLGFEAGLGEGTDAFVTGKVAMIYTGPWMLSNYMKYGKDLDFGVVAPPSGPTGGKGSVMGGFGLVIAEASKNKEAAWEFEKWWLANADNALLWAKTSNNIPGNLKAIADPFFQDNPLYKPFMETLEFAKIRPTFSGYFPMEEKAVTPNLQLFMEGKQDAATTLKKAEEQGANELKNAK